MQSTQKRRVKKQVWWILGAIVFLLIMWWWFSSGGDKTKGGYSPTMIVWPRDKPLCEKFRKKIRNYCDQTKEDHCCYAPHDLGTNRTDALIYYRSNIGESFYVNPTREQVASPVVVDEFEYAELKNKDSVYLNILFKEIKVHNFSDTIVTVTGHEAYCVIQHLWIMENKANPKRNMKDVFGGDNHDEL